MFAIRWTLALCERSAIDTDVSSMGCTGADGICRRAAKAFNGFGQHAQSPCSKAGVRGDVLRPGMILRSFWVGFLANLRRPFGGAVSPDRYDGEERMGHQKVKKRMRKRIERAQSSIDSLSKLAAERAALTRRARQFLTGEVDEKSAPATIPQSRLARSKRDDGWAGRFREFQ
uniref:hypothetical protein n=1 Tax=Burkholderia arboris TaxID=488730 RepID=UPI003BEEE10C